MKSLIWPVAAVAVVGALDLWNGAGAASLATVPTASDGSAVAPPEAVWSTLAHLREEVRPGADGALVIANDAYRASFSAADRVVYTPRHGNGLEPRLTWNYRARAIATDTVTRSLDVVAPAVSAAGDHVVDFLRPGLVERYVGDTAGVEQVFVLTGRPAGAGDVRIVGDVAFEGAVRAKDGGLEFDAGGGLPPFTYRAPIAFDAHRVPIPVRAEWAAGTLTLVLDAASLDRATWPVTIDPLLGIQTVALTDQTTGVDIASNVRGELLVVYDTRDAFDPDKTLLRLRRFYETGDAIAAAVTIHQGDGQSLDRKPRIACDDMVDRCLVVWERDSINFQARGLLLSGAGTVLKPSFSVGPGAVDGFYATQERSPRVAARSQRPHVLADPAFVVTWNEYEATQGEFAQFARISGIGDTLGEGHVSIPDESPVDTAYDPHADRFMMVWRTGSAVRACIVVPTGGLGTTFTVQASSTESPYVAYDIASRRYLFVYQHETAASFLKGRLFTGGTSPTAVGPEQTLIPSDDGTAVLYPTGLIAQNGTFLMAYQKVPGPGDARLARVGADLSFIEDVPIALGKSFPNYAITQAQYVLGGGYDSTAARFVNQGRWAPALVHGAGGDFDGDGKGDLFAFRPSSGRFYVRQSSVPDGNLLSTVMFSLGGQSHIPVLLDWDGDALADVAVFSMASGRWTIRLSTTGAIEQETLGRGGDIPVPGDYLGGVADEIGVWRPSTGEWFIRERGSSSTTTVTWGVLGDQPVPADYDNDGKHELCVFRPSTSQFFRVELNLTGSVVTTFGQPGDTAFAGNFVGGPHADFVVFRRGTWYIADGTTMAASQVTTNGRIPVAIDRDGDGILGVAVFNENNGNWIIKDGIWSLATFGQTGDVPAGH